MSANEEKYRLVPDNERAIERYRNFVFYFTFIAYANSHLSRKCYTNLKVGRWLSFLCRLITMLTVTPVLVNNLNMIIFCLRFKFRALV